MREIILSGHINQKITELERKRLAKDAAELLAYDQAVRVRDQKIASAYGNWKKALRNWWKLFKLLSAGFRYRRAVKSLSPQAPWPNAKSKDELMMRAGQESENSVAHAVNDLLPGDAWVLIRGYRNKKGEIDQILVGPAAIIAMEIKYRKARVSCSGDDTWYEERLDSWHNVVEEPKRIADKKGRSPSRQVLEPIESLRTFLKKRNISADILPVVVLSHPMAEIGSCEKASVELITTYGLEKIIWRECRSANHAILVEDVVNMIAKDHDYWQQNKQQNGHDRAKERDAIKAQPVTT